MDGISPHWIKLFVEFLLLDVALSDTMGADFLLWNWRVIYVSQNNKIFPNIQKNTPVGYIKSKFLLRVDELLVGSADQQTLRFD